MSVQIMIVDDSEVEHALIGAMLQVLLPGVKLVHANGVLSALRYLRETARLGEPLPDLIITDLNMPILNGWQLCAILKANPEFRAIPVIMATTEASANPKSGFSLIEEEGIIRGWVQKPIALDAFRNSLRRVFPWHFSPVNFLVIYEEEQLLRRSVLQNMRAWLVNVLKYPHPFTINRPDGASLLLEHNVGGIIVGPLDQEVLHRMLREVRNHEAGKHLPIIAYMDPSDVTAQSAAVEAGASGFLPLPMRGDELFAGLKRFFGAPPCDWPKSPEQQPLHLVGATQASD